jgi:hypothetical protein
MALSTVVVRFEPLFLKFLLRIDAARAACDVSGACTGWLMQCQYRRRDGIASKAVDPVHRNKTTAWIMPAR